MPDKDINLSIVIHGDVLGTLNVAGRDVTAWSQARQQNIPPDQIAPPVFVSYASADRAQVVEPLVRRLQDAGYTVWYDQQNLVGGDDWKREIDTAIRRCVAFIAVLTPPLHRPRRASLGGLRAAGGAAAVRAGGPGAARNL